MTDQMAAPLPTGKPSVHYRTTATGAALTVYAFGCVWDVEVSGRDVKSKTFFPLHEKEESENA